MKTKGGSEFVALAAKVDELSELCARLSRENAELREHVSRMSPASDPVPLRVAAGSPESGSIAAGAREQDEGPHDKLSRRKLGKALGAAAATAVGAAVVVDATARPAAAANGNAVTAGATTTAEAATTVKYDGTTNPGVIFLAHNTSFAASAAGYPAALGGWAAGGTVSNGIYGYTEVGTGYAIVGSNTSQSGRGTAVAGFSDSSSSNAYAILGTIQSINSGGFSAGVRGVNNGTGSLGTGVYGSHAGAGFGVYGTTDSGIGVYGQGSGTTGTGVTGQGSTGVSGFGGAIGVSAQGVSGVQANGSATGVSAIGGTTGLAATAPTAVNASGTGTAGVGVRSSGAGAGGRGGVFSGAAAQIHLSPGSLPTHPASGKRGDLYADDKGRLWFCKSGGNTAVWHQIA